MTHNCYEFPLILAVSSCPFSKCKVSEDAFFGFFFSAAFHSRSRSLSIAASSWTRVVSTIGVIAPSVATVFGENFAPPSSSPRGPKGKSIVVIAVKRSPNDRSAATATEKNTAVGAVRMVAACRDQVLTKRLSTEPRRGTSTSHHLDTHLQLT